MKVLALTLSFLLTLACRADVALTWTHGVADPSLRNTVQRSPATVHTHSGNSGPFVKGLHIPYTWTARQQFFKDGVEWTLQWHGGRTGDWYWTAPTHLASPFNIRGEWLPIPNSAWQYRYVIEPEGFRLQAPTIYANKLGTRDLWWRHYHASFYGLGGESTSRIYGTTPSVYGTCSVSDQSLSYPGSLYGFTSLPEFFGWSYDDWSSGLLIIGPNPYPLSSFAVADHNTSGSVTAQDIFDYLISYFSSSPAADLDHSSTINEADLFTYLACWFSSPRTLD